MSEVKVTELNEKTAPHKDDLLYLIDMENNIDKKIKYGSIRPYKEISFLTTQTANYDPEIDVLNNELGAISSYIRDQEKGAYQLTIRDAFPEDKVEFPNNYTIMWSRNAGYQFILTIERVSDDAVVIKTNDLTNTPVDSVLDDTPIKIRVYN